MPFTYRLDTDIKIFYQLVYGHCTFNDIFSIGLKPELNPANRPRVKFIIDDRLGDLETDVEGMNVFIKFMLDLKKSGFELEPTAFLTTDKGLSIFVKSLELLIDDTIAIHQVFSSLDEAIIWLDETENSQAIHRIHIELLQELQFKHRV
ncbi:MAG: hypothetical protein U0V02_07710 [Anaerolineales bacterium]